MRATNDGIAVSYTIGAVPQSASSWFPCEHPERPNDAAMVWHYKCRGCHVAAVASQRRWPDDPSVQRMVGLTQPDDDDVEAWL